MGLATSGAGAVAPVGRYRRRPGKLAEQLALRIEADILAAGWPVGANLGSEGDLVAGYGVSRAILREAVRITEYLGLAEMRRGPGGGLIVTSPDPSAVLTAVVVYLTFRQVRLEQVMQARHPIEELAVRLASERRTPADVNAMWKRLSAELAEPRADHWVLHDMLAAVSGNPAVELFTEILSRVTGQYRATDRMAEDDRRERLLAAAAAHRALVDSVANGESATAARRIHHHLDAIELSLLEGGSVPTPALGDVMSTEGQGDKRSIVVARQIFAEVVARGWPVGALLGSEPDLQQRYIISRAVLREALRLLEFHHVVRTKRGPGGGILIGTPDGDATTEAMAVYLQSRQITLEQLIEVREAVELAVIDLAVDGFGPEAIQALWDTLADEQAAPVTTLGTYSHRLHLRLAELTGNDAIVLFVHALTRLTEHHQVGADAWISHEEGAESVARAHRSIVRAIAARDGVKAKQRMLVHLRALTGMLE